MGGEPKPTFTVLSPGRARPSGFPDTERTGVINAVLLVDVNTLSAMLSFKAGYPVFTCHIT